MTGSTREARAQPAEREPPPEQGHHHSDRPLVCYADLIREAHQRGVRRLETEIIQLPTATNGQLAVVKAQVSTHTGRFTGLGDASPESVEPEFLPHLLRVAETRAKARALRDALGVGLVAVEELVAVEPTPAPTPRTEPRLMTADQRRLLFRLAYARGFTGQEAHQFLKQALETEDLAQVTAEAAQTAIQALKQGNGRDRGQEVPHA